LLVFGALQNHGPGDQIQRPADPLAYKLHNKKIKKYLATGVSFSRYCFALLEASAVFEPSDI
jgi:hypothetical protein